MGTLVTNAQIIDEEKLGLSYNTSALRLGIERPSLISRVKKLGIDWRGKGKHPRQNPLRYQCA